ncbi:hypothetical protein ACIRL2_48120 [Embleya sp. NPDC127516]|uniref:hypothetical protein n=1 Tax=Embleya sp. NPDC127516 TaxID=3363990 RepID=UPI0037F25DFC
MLRSRPRPAVSVASLVTAGLLLAGCASPGSPTAEPSAGTPTGSETQPVGDTVCAGLLPTSSVTTLLPAEPAFTSEDQPPLEHYPVLRCRVSAGDRAFVGSAYLFNMAGAERVQLPGLTTTGSAPLGDKDHDLYGMAGADDAWLVQNCKVQNVEGPVPMLVRARTIGPAGAPNTPDQRQQLADLAVELANGVAKVAGCGSEPTPRPGEIKPANDPKPITDARVCGMLDPAALGPQAAGEQRARWTAAATPEGPGAIQGCDLFLEGTRVLSFAIVHGYLAPGAEVPGERAILSERLPTGGVPNDAQLAGTVEGKVLGRCDGHTVAYQLSRHNGEDPPGLTLGQPTETFFKSFANGASQWGFKCEPIAPDADWQIRR